uniref:Uncharacterized protein n=1 Tax=Romanomermis culicivorax TaxID=13658 RepID=A0A915IXR7_ROMCU
MSNSIKLRPNQLIARAKHTLGYAEPYADCQVATAATHCDLTDHEPAALDKSFPCHTAQQKLEFALNKMTEKTHVSAAQKNKGSLHAMMKPRRFQPPRRQTHYR